MILWRWNYTYFQLFLALVMDTKCVKLFQIINYLGRMPIFGGKSFNSNYLKEFSLIIVYTYRIFTQYTHRIFWQVKIHRSKIVQLIQCVPHMYTCKYICNDRKTYLCICTKICRKFKNIYWRISHRTETLLMNKWMYRIQWIIINMIPNISSKER